MTHMKHSLCSVFLALAVLLGAALPVHAADSAESDAAISKTVNYLLQTVSAPRVGSIGGEWSVIGLARSGATVPQSYWDGYYAAVKTTLTETQGVLSNRKYTEYSRVILALTAIGADPGCVGGYNLLLPLADYDKTILQGVNGSIWALIALDSGNYAIPANSNAKTQATRELYLQHILSKQQSGGGWGFSDSRADVDLTAMALQALAGYQDRAEVKKAIENGINWLSAAQNADGGFSVNGLETSESCAQVLTAMSTLGIAPDDARFTKNGHTVSERLLGYQLHDGSFSHDGNKSNLMATEQAFYALAAMQRNLSGMNGLYQMSDAARKVSSAGLPDAHPDITKTSIMLSDATFSDIAGHKDRIAIESLAARKIINGMGDGTFAPDKTMTRAEFSVILVNALGLQPRYADVFTDVDRNDWYANYVGTAYQYGIIHGMGDGTFHPDGTITRQDAMVMISTAARLCGLETQLTDSQISAALSGITDAGNISDYARNAAAFCCNSGVADGNTLNPQAAILRCDVAQMLYRLMQRSNLL